MPTPSLTKEQATATYNLMKEVVEDGFVIDGTPSAYKEAARRMGVSKSTLVSRYQRGVNKFNLKPIKPKPYVAPAQATSTPHFDIEAMSEKVRVMLKPGPKSLAEIASRTKCLVGEVLDIVGLLGEKGVHVQRHGDMVSIAHEPQHAYVTGSTVEILSRKDNTYCFGAFGDLHAGSKYCRWDVRTDLVKLAEQAGAQAIMDQGNWIDGDARFNRYDLEASGLEAQCQLLAERHPRTKLPIYAVSGDDHEGFVAQREGLDVGKYCENIMRAAGHNWTDLGYMEAHIILKNANTGKTATLAIVHPGGGSSYALSYSIQKIVESYEGGEKPNVAFYGHYHKLWAGIIRNVWVVQTGTQQDQTPFMRKKRLEAHVGGAIVTLRQHPETGSIISMCPELIKYYNKGWNGNGNLWSHHGPVVQPKRTRNGI